MPYRDKKLMVQALLVILTVRLGLWVVPFALLSRWLSVTDKPNFDHQAADWTTVRSIIRSIRTFSPYVPRATCLTQALSACVLLRMYAQSSCLKIGVEKDQDEKFGAHAWVEVDGRIVIGKQIRHDRFAVLRSSSAVL
jgi:Transglutaminase-like superfamily